MPARRASTTSGLPAPSRSRSRPPGHRRRCRPGGRPRRRCRGRGGGPRPPSPLDRSRDVMAHLGRMRAIALMPAPPMPTRCTVPGCPRSSSAWSAGMGVDQLCDAGPPHRGVLVRSEAAAPIARSRSRIGQSASSWVTRTVPSHSGSGTCTAAPIRTIASCVPRLVVASQRKEAAQGSPACPR